MEKTLVILVFLVAVGNILPVTSLCQDIDPAACPALAAQTPNFCHEPGLASVVCPRYCKLCPLQCFSCTFTNTESPWCSNITECQKGEQCMIRELQSSVDGHQEIIMQCASPQVCDLISPSEGLVGKRDVSIHCCKEDFCNTRAVITSPPSMTTTNVPTTTPPTTPTTPPPTTTLTPTTTMSTTSTTKPTTLPPGCNVDLTILIEDSSSRSSFDTWAITDFLVDTVDKLRVGLQYNKVAVSLFDTSIHKKWTFGSGEAIDKGTLKTAIDELSFTFRRDDIDYDDVADYIHQLSNHTLTKDRVGVKDVVLIIADNDIHSRQLTGQHFGVDTILYISINHSVLTGSFHTIAQHMFSVRDKNVGQGLMRIQLQVLAALCDANGRHH